MSRTQFNTSRFSGSIKMEIFKKLKQGMTTTQIALDLQKPRASLEKHILNNRQYYYAD